MVGRILTRLKRQAACCNRPAPAFRDSRRPCGPGRTPCANPGSMRSPGPATRIEVDTLDVRPVPGVIFKPFTARDGISRWDLFQTHTRATAQTAAQFLDTLQHRMPFPLRAVQVMAVPSSPPKSNSPASSAACICSCCLPDWSCLFPLRQCRVRHLPLRRQLLAVGNGLGDCVCVVISAEEK